MCGKERGGSPPGGTRDGPALWATGPVGSAVAFAGDSRAGQSFSAISSRTSSSPIPVITTQAFMTGIGEDDVLDEIAEKL